MKVFMNMIPLDLGGDRAEHLAAAMFSSKAAAVPRFFDWIASRFCGSICDFSAYLLMAFEVVKRRQIDVTCVSDLKLEAETETRPPRNNRRPFASLVLRAGSAPAEQTAWVFWIRVVIAILLASSNYQP
jgi:hypothetical protein